MAFAAVTPPGWVRLRTGVHGPVVMDIRRLSRRNLETYYYLYGSAGVYVQYLGHKDDLAAAGCLRLNRVRYHRFNDDGHGGLLYVSNKAERGKRGQIAVSYYTNNRAFAGSLPGMRDHFPKVLKSMTPGPVRSPSVRPPSPAAALNALYDDFLERLACRGRQDRDPDRAEVVRILDLLDDRARRKLLRIARQLLGESGADLDVRPLH